MLYEVITNQEVAERIRDFLRRTMPEYVDRVTLHQEKRPIFSRYQTEEQIATIYKRQVPLPAGGSIVIDPTEALVITSYSIHYTKLYDGNAVFPSSASSTLVNPRSRNRFLMMRLIVEKSSTTRNNFV